MISNHMLICLIVSLLSLISLCTTVLGQNVDDYMEYKPPVPQIRLKPPNKLDSLLYAHKDSSQIDATGNGFRDDIETRLKEIASRFSPILYKNTDSHPVDFRKYITHLVVDTWNLWKYKPELDAGSFDIPFSDMYHHPDISDFLPPSKLNEFPKLKIKKLQNYNIETPYQETDFRSVLWFDIVGNDPETWHLYPRLESYWSPPTAYVHPFIWKYPDEAEYEFVLQYWFFYPFNDSANDHEGDWEHINVLITPRSKIDKKPLTQEEISGIIGGAIHLNSLRIKRVDSYFHHFCVVNDAVTVNEKGEYYLAPSSSKGSVPGVKIENNHPILYIGGDDISATNLLDLPGKAENQDSHGTYPWPGIWLFGPGETGRERIRQKKDRIQVENLILVPNLEYLDFSKSQVKKDWAWLVLPAFWGQPVNPSLLGLGERFKGADLGQYAPVGITYNGGWNRIGDSPNFEKFNPRKLSYSEKQRDLRHMNFSKLGFLNIFLLPTHIPPANFLFTRITPPIYGSSEHAKEIPELLSDKGIIPLWWNEFHFGFNDYHPDYASNEDISANVIDVIELAKTLSFIFDHFEVGSVIKPVSLVNSGKPNTDRENTLKNFTSISISDRHGWTLSTSYWISPSFGLRTGFQREKMNDISFHLPTFYRLRDHGSANMRFATTIININQMSLTAYSGQFVVRLLPILEVLRVMDVDLALGVRRLDCGFRDPVTFSLIDVNADSLSKTKSPMLNVPLSNARAWGVLINLDIKLALLDPTFFLRTKFRILPTMKLQFYRYNLKNEFGDGNWRWLNNASFGFTFAF